MEYYFKSQIGLLEYYFKQLGQITLQCPNKTIYLHKTDKMNTKKPAERKDDSRFTVYKNELENKWVIEDSETSNVLTFIEGKVETEGYFATFKDGKVMTDTRLVGQTIREMDEFLRTNYKHLYGKTKTKK